MVAGDEVITIKEENNEFSTPQQTTPPGSRDKPRIVRSMVDPTISQREAIEFSVASLFWGQILYRSLTVAHTVRIIKVQNTVRKRRTAYVSGELYKFTREYEKLYG